MSTPGTPDPHDALTPEERLVDEILGDDAQSGLAAHVRPVLSPRARRRIALQQAMHGLLRSLHSADAASRETRIERVMTRVRTHAAGGIAGVLRRGRWRLAAAAAILVLGAVALFTWAPFLSYFQSEALAVVARAVDHLEASIDREFKGRFTIENATTGVAFQGTPFRLFAGGKGRFVAEVDTLGGFPLRGPIRLGILRNRRWLQFGSERMEITDKPLPPPFGDLDLGMLELDQVLRKLPSSFEIKSWGRVVPTEPGAAGQVQLTAVPRAGAAPRAGMRKSPIQQVELIADEATGHLRRVEILAEGPMRRGERGRVRLVIEHTRTLTLPATFYEGDK